MSNKTKRNYTKKFFTELRKALTEVPAIGKGSGVFHKNTLASVYAKYPKLPSTLKSFIDYLLLANCLPARNEFKRRSDYSVLVTKWKFAISDSHCGYCGVKLKARKLLGSNPTKNYCSNTCSASSLSVQQQYKATCLVRYGHECPNSSSVVQRRKRATNKERYGVPELMQNTQVLAKRSSTWEEKYIGGHPNRDPAVLKKTKLTCDTRYGGVGLASASTMKAYKKTILKVYGKSHISKVTSIHEKQHKVKTKDVRIAGRLFTSLQGYEAQAIELLISRGISPKRIITSKKFVGSFEYLFAGKEHTYYPDILVTGGDKDTFVEVKSEYTFNYDKPVLRAKLKAVRDSGARVILLVLTKNGQIVKFRRWD